MIWHNGVERLTVNGKGTNAAKESNGSADGVFVPDRQR
jgi:hypothetical protein